MLKPRLPPDPAPNSQGDSPTALPTERSHAARFRKTRVAHSAALSEDYAELIADLLQSAGEARVTDIARHLGVSHATVNKSVNKMKREGLATARPYRGVFLTEAGIALADRVRARASPGGRPAAGRRGSARGRRAGRRGHRTLRVRRRPAGI